MIEIIVALIAAVMLFISSNFNRIFNKLDDVQKDVSHIKNNCKYCDKDPGPAAPRRALA